MRHAEPVRGGSSRYRRRSLRIDPPRGCLPDGMDALGAPQ
jgi:hypothetical protein